MFWKREKTTIVRPEELEAEIRQGRLPITVDVRSAKDYEASHLPGAINIPLDELELREAELDRARPTVFY
jgi:rhodanese-related sulfurtransferase